MVPFSLAKNRGQCLDKLIERYPAIKSALFDTDDKLHGYIQVFVNGVIAYSEVLNAPVKDGDNILISIFIGGG